MKSIPIIILIFCPVFLLSQEINKFNVVDTIPDVETVLRQSLNSDLFLLKNKKGETDSLYFFGVLGLSEFPNNQKNDEESKVLGVCKCQILRNDIKIKNTDSYLGLIENSITINLLDSSYQSNLYLHSFGAYTLKLNKNDNYVDKIKLSIKDTILEISTDSELEHNGTIRGKLAGITESYYLKVKGYKDGKKTQHKILSIFECKL